MRRSVSWLCVFVSFLWLASCVPAPDKPASVAPAVQAELTSRWNLSSAGVTAPFPGGGTVGFEWDVYEQFPHPTYKGGTVEAYTAFSQVFLDFFSRSDNFEFLKQKELLNMRLLYKTDGGLLLLDTTFDKLSEELADPNYLLGVLTTDEHNQLKRVHQMIHAAR